MLFRSQIRDQAVVARNVALVSYWANYWHAISVWVDALVANQNAHVLSLPPAFVLSQDQTLKFNVPSPKEGRDPVTNYRSTRKSNFELATAETFALLKAQTSAAAGVSLSKQTMHRAHDPGGRDRWQNWEPFGSQNPSPQLRATFSVRPVRRGSRAYMGVGFGCQTLNCRTFTGSWESPKSPSNLLYCCAPTGFPASIYSYTPQTAAGDKIPGRRSNPSRGPDPPDPQ